MADKRRFTASVDPDQTVDGALLHVYVQIVESLETVKLFAQSFYVDHPFSSFLQAISSSFPRIS